MMMHCANCGGQLAVASLRASGHEAYLAGDFTLGISGVEARVCLSCGQITLCAVNPTALRPHVQAAAPRPATTPGASRETE